MAEIVVFTPKAGVTARENLAGFVDMCRHHLTVFGSELHFDALLWDVTDSVQLKGHGRKRVRVAFSNFESVDSDSPKPMAEPFLSFAKGYIRYQQALRPVKNLALRVAVMRALEAALVESAQGADPSQISAGTLNRAAQLLEERLGPETAYRAGSQLKMVAEFLAENQLTQVPIVHWQNPLPRPLSGVRVGKEFEERRAEKMPSRAALEALAKAFRLADEPPDIIATSFGALAVSSPDRANEILHLPAMCEVREKRQDGSDAFGLRWFSSKGADSTVKWIVRTMVEVVELALRNIRSVTDEARQVAKWYEVNPDRMYLRSNVEHLRGNEKLSMRDAALILWGDAEANNSVTAFTRDNKIHTQRDGWRTFVNFRDIERVVLEMLPDGFPYLNREVGIKYSEALFVALKNQLHDKRGTYTCVIDPVTVNQINSRLGARVKFGFESVFTRFGLTENDGAEIKISSHQFRHYLNTLAQMGGLSQLDIALWSGRKDLDQNEKYDHTTPVRRAERMRAMIGRGEEIVGPLATMPAKLPISRDEFLALKIPTAHESEFGFCVHDYSTSPCELHLDCINCNEHVCIKGDVKKTEMLQRKLAESNAMLSAVNKAKADGHFAGNDRGTMHLIRTNHRLRALCEILDDPKTADGAIVQLSNVNAASRIATADADRERKLGVAERRRLRRMAALLED